MHFLTLIPFLALLTLAAPIEKRAPSVSCGGRSFTSSQVNKAVQNSNSDAAPSSSYPHQYNNYEGFDFSDYCSDSRYEEFPLTSGGYTGGSPGAYRVITGQSSGAFCGAIYHASSDNSFSSCNY
ncbi:Ribonuclease/ribotoxin [Jaminaea rosea]|uniref:Ribonuclease/ribotoxin n=1 Tax=Jaminaea rosea TaxID=1569628 RepID=A0A316UT24_9BASI|nr:Ribonuclease/ribotoxin [Jaminaea rosea]PWN28437.1 Ribonuclease/ribotoxin [Jaminaea rosea]